MHFVGGVKSNDPLNPAYNLTLFPKIYKKKAPTDNSRFARARKRHIIKETINTTNIIEENGRFQPANIQEIGVQTDFSDIYEEGPSLLFCWNSHTDASTQTNIVMSKNDQAVKKMVADCKPKMKNSSCGPDIDMTEGFVGFDNIATDLIMSQLGGVSLSFFSVLLSLIIPGKDGQPSYYKKVNKKNRLLLFLMKMKLGITFCALGCIFRIHATTASAFFFEMLDSLTKATETWIFWPSKAAIKKSLPLAFHNYPNCRVIIDCTEIKCDSPPTVKQRVLMYSNYKGCFTLKFLIGITPNGFISFLSKAYGGRATDGFITNDSGFLNLIEPGDMVMADKGFPQIKSELIERKSILVIPPFCFNPQFTEQEVEETYKIASVRIHVERAIQRTKLYNILKHINVEIFPHIDKIMKTCCILANHLPPLIKNSNK